MGKGSIRTKWERVGLEVQEEAWRRKWVDTKRHGEEGTFRSRQRGNFCRGNERERGFTGWGDRGAAGTRRWTAALAVGQIGGFSYRMELTSGGRPHLQEERRKAEGEGNSDFPGRPQSRPQLWPSCLLAERKPQFPSCPGVASLGKHWRRLCSPKLLGPEVRV